MKPMWTLRPQPVPSRREIALLTSLPTTRLRKMTLSRPHPHTDYTCNKPLNTGGSDPGSRVNSLGSYPQLVLSLCASDLIWIAWWSSAGIHAPPLYSWSSFRSYWGRTSELRRIKIRRASVWSETEKPSWRMSSDVNFGRREQQVEGRLRDD